MNVIWHEHSAEGADIGIAICLPKPLHGRPNIIFCADVFCEEGARYKRETKCGDEYESPKALHATFSCEMYRMSFGARCLYRHVGLVVPLVVVHVALIPARSRETPPMRTGLSPVEEVSSERSSNPFSDAGEYGLEWYPVLRFECQRPWQRDPAARGDQDPARRRCGARPRLHQTAPGSFSYITIGGAGLMSDADTAVPAPAFASCPEPIHHDPLPS